jgi:hypothetical protein
MNQQQRQPQGAPFGKRLMYSAAGMFGAMMATQLAIGLAAPAMIDDSCNALADRMRIEGNLHLNPDPATGQLSADQKQLSACFSTFSQVAFWLPLLAGVGGYVAAGRYADRRHGQPPAPR